MSEATLDLPAAVVGELRAALPAVAERTVVALTAEVPEYDRAGGEVTATIQGAVELALATFLDASTLRGEGLPATPLTPVLEAAYALGRGEARQGRTMEALLAAYRIGARVAWEEQSALIVRRRVPAAVVARYAQLVFTYIDQLSGASAAGHRDELATSGRVREQLLERLALALIEGQPAEEIEARAAHADWPLPESITVVLISNAHAANAAQVLGGRTLRLPGDDAPDIAARRAAVLLVPDAHRSRAALLAALAGRGSVVGPTGPWRNAGVSYRRAVRAAMTLELAGDEPLDTEQHLVELIVNADADALHDLRARALEPLAGISPVTADRLTETLRSWLLHQGRREDVAADLHVHPQTVRYRMTQLRALFGERLTDQSSTLELIVALAAGPRSQATGP